MPEGSYVPTGVTGPVRHLGRCCWRVVSAAVIGLLLVACSGSGVDGRAAVADGMKSMTLEETACFRKFVLEDSEKERDLGSAAGEQVESWLRECRYRLVFDGQEERVKRLPSYVAICMEGLALSTPIGGGSFNALEDQCRKQCLEDPYSKQLIVGGILSSDSPDALIEKNCSDRPSQPSTTVPTPGNDGNQGSNLGGGGADNGCDLAGECNEGQPSELFDDVSDDPIDPCSGYNTCVHGPSGEYGKDYINDPNDVANDGR